MVNFETESQPLCVHAVFLVILLIKLNQIMKIMQVPLILL